MIESAFKSMIAGFLSAMLTPSVLAQSPPAEWECKVCDPTFGWNWDIEGAATLVANDAYRFGDYTGYDDSGAYLFTDIFGRYVGANAHYGQVEGYMRGSKSLGLFLKGGKQSHYELRGFYQAIPRRFFGTTLTPFSGSGGADLSLPVDWVRAPVTQQFTALENSQQALDIGLDWSSFGIGGDYNLGKNWSFSADFTRREKQGVKRSAGSFFNSASEFASPIDYTTDEIELVADYATATWQLSARYIGSFFANKNNSLQWDNPYSVPTGVDSGAIALAPDNSSHQVSVAGSLLLPMRTTLNGQIAIGNLSQDELLLPYSSNALSPGPALPRSGAQAEVDTFNFNIRATSSPWRSFTMEGELRYNQFDNKTPVAAFDYVITDAAPSPTAAMSTAYDYDRRELKLRAEYRANRTFKLLGGLDNERMERDRQDRSSTTTNRLWMTLRSRFGQVADVNLNWYDESRDGSTFDVLVNPLSQQNPLMRKYNLADRERTAIRVYGSIFAMQNLDIGWELDDGTDEYKNSTIGLTKSDYLSYGLNASYLFANNAAVYGSLYQEDIQTDQSNSQLFSLPDWTATTDDRFTTLTLGSTFPELLDLFDARIEYSWSDASGKWDSDTSGLPTAFPDLESTRHYLNVGLSYPFSNSLTFKVDYVFEKFESSDWALDDVEPNTIPSLLGLGASAWNYNVSVFYFSVVYRRDAS